MASMNNCNFSGRLTRDPELKYTPGGMAVTTFRLAVDRRKSKDGEDQTDWLDFVCFEKTAENVAKFLVKGSPVIIEGARAQSRTWEGQDGKRNYAVEFVAGQVHFLETKAQTDARRGGGQSAAPAPQEVAGGDDPFAGQ